MAYETNYEGMDWYTMIYWGDTITIHGFVAPTTDCQRDATGLYSETNPYITSWNRNILGIAHQQQAWLGFVWGWSMPMIEHHLLTVTAIARHQSILRIWFKAVTSKAETTKKNVAWARWLPFLNHSDLSTNHVACMQCMKTRTFRISYKHDLQRPAHSTSGPWQTNMFHVFCISKMPFLDGADPMITCGVPLSGPPSLLDISHHYSVGALWHPLGVWKR